MLDHAVKVGVLNGICGRDNPKKVIMRQQPLNTRCNTYRKSKNTIRFQINYHFHAFTYKNASVIVLRGKIFFWKPP